MGASSAMSIQFKLFQVANLEENEQIELKETKGQHPVKSIVNTSDEYVVAFLNACGGAIHWGVRDSDRITVGVQLTAADKDAIRKEVASKLHTIQPAIDPTTWKLDFTPLAAEAETPTPHVVSIYVSPQLAGGPFFTAGGDCYVRLNGLNQKLRGPTLTEFLRTRLIAPNQATLGTPGADRITDPRIAGLAQRIRKIIIEHGIEYSQLPRFLRETGAPFAIEVGDLQSDERLIEWLNEDRIDWIAETFLIRKEWIHGEDEQIHHDFYFDKQPNYLYRAIKTHMRDPILVDRPVAYFIRCRENEKWVDSWEMVHVIIEIPLLHLGPNRTVNRYISDHQGHPWSYQRSHVQLRAWARLLDVHMGIHCYGKDANSSCCRAIESNSVFLRNIVESQVFLTPDDWVPGDYARHANESAVAKETGSMASVIEFLREHSLPCHNKPLR